MFQVYKMYINGEFLNADSKKLYNVINPGTEEIIGKVPIGTEEDVNAAVSAARNAFDSGDWPELSPAERSRILLKLADLVEKESELLAVLESTNQGKTIRYARENDLPAALDCLRFFAGACRSIQGAVSGNYTDHTSGSGISILRREPIGVVGAIVPWNYPLLIAAWKIAPALAAGNTIVVKPASATPLTILEIAKLAHNAGIPPGVFNVVTGPGEVVGAALVRHPNVDMITFTGDTSTGKKIIEESSNSVKKIQLELGGKAPFIVFEDADIDAAVQGAVTGGIMNNGQDCTAAARFYVQEKIYYTFIKAFAEEIKNVKLGDQLDHDTDMGPLVSQRHWARVNEYIQSARKDGAKIVTGGKRPAGKDIDRGFFMQPTLIAEATQHMRIVQEEVFGPVFPVVKFSTLDDAIIKANDTMYGLAASVWTRDIKKAAKAANMLRFGTVWINDHGLLVSEMPHGGYKQSGFGRDLSTNALEEFTQTKHVYIDTTEARRKPWYDTVYKEKKK